jgi:hypothetical protein
MSFEKTLCPFVAKKLCESKKEYKGNSWFISHLNHEHSAEERKGLESGDYTFGGLNTLCECGFLRKSNAECTRCKNPQPPSVVDLTGRKGRAPVSEWVRKDGEGEEWARHLFGDDWRQCFLDFVVAGPDPDRKDDEEDPFWVLRYPDHDFDEDYMEQSRLVVFLTPEPVRDAIDVDALAAAEEVGRDLKCKECELHVPPQGLDCSSCSAKIHNQCGVRLRQDLLCLSCFERKSSVDDQAIFDLFRTYRGKNMFSMQAVCLALDSVLKKAKIEPGPLLPCFRRACHAVLTKNMSHATQGDWGAMQQEGKIHKATEAWATARRTVKFTLDGKAPRANKKFYLAIAKTVDIALTFQTVNERLDPQEVQRLVLPNESSPEEDLEESQWGTVSDVALSAHASVTGALELLGELEESKTRTALRGKLEKAQRLAWLAHESAQSLTSWEALRANVNGLNAPPPPHSTPLPPAQSEHRFEVEKISGAGGHCLYRAVSKIVGEIQNSSPPSVEFLRNTVAVEALCNLELLRQKFRVGAETVARRALTGENGQGEELFLLAKVFRFNPTLYFPYTVKPCAEEVSDGSMQGYRRAYLVYHGVHDPEEGKDYGHFDLLAHLTEAGGKARKAYTLNPSNTRVVRQARTFLDGLREAGQKSTASQDLASYNKARRTKRVSFELDQARSQQQALHQDSSQQRQGAEQKQAVPSVEVLVHGIKMG